MGDMYMLFSGSLRTSAGSSDAGEQLFVYISFKMSVPYLE